jgi:cell division septal protein FtsQ
MNAGGHGSDIASSIELAKIFHLGKGIVANVKASDLGLRFRGSDLGPEHVVLSATFALSWGDKTASEAEMAEIVRWRREHQPGGQNAGSVFVNPEPGGGSSGAIIDRLGLRGFRIGSAEVSPKHANFIQCDPDGSADDVVAVMTHVRGRVRDELGIDLRSEVRLVGFAPQVAEAAGAARDDGRADARSATTALDRVFGPLTGDETLGVVTIAPPLPDDAVAELAELFAPTGEIARPTGDTPANAAPDSTPTSDVSSATPSDSSSSATPGDTPVAPVVDISAAVTTPSVPRGPVVIDDTALRLPHERTEGSAAITVDDESRSGSVTIDPTSPFADPRTGVVDDDSLAAVIVDDRLTRRRLPRWLRVRRVSPLVALGIFIVLSSLTLVVLASPIFAVRRIEVTGLTYTDAVLLESVKDSLNGASVFTADLDSAKRRLEGDPWVRSARLAWYLPDRVVIEIDERTPVTWFVGVDNRARVLDREGRVLQVLEGQPTQFLKIEGVGPNLAAGTVTTPVYTGAAQLATSLPSEVEKRVKHLNVDGPEQLGMTLKTGTVVKLGAPVDLRYKLVIVATVLAQQDPKFIVSIDVSSGQAVVQNA